ncbi:hypothetical protein BJY00DRAFT_164858 [Aspergillus carlsbadensis]|nr:hypothetical protein BJY00DRAFT_164858 [Aspergillus carlsbadensis]
MTRLKGPDFLLHCPSLSPLIYPSPFPQSHHHHNHSIKQLSHSIRTYSSQDAKELPQKNASNAEILVPVALQSPHPGKVSIHPPKGREALCVRPTSPVKRRSHMRSTHFISE